MNGEGDFLVESVRSKAANSVPFQADYLIEIAVGPRDLQVESDFGKF